jgi:hypothetical protein
MGTGGTFTTGAGGTFTMGAAGAPIGSKGGSGPIGATGGTSMGSPKPMAAAPAPAVEITLPAADEPVDQMQSDDEQIREQYGDKTLSGRSARVTH